MGKLAAALKNRQEGSMQIEVRLRELGQQLWGSAPLADIAEVVRTEVQGWYANLPENWFDNTEPFPDGTPRHGGKRTFMRPLSTSWQTELRADGFNVYFLNPRTDGSPWGLRLQQYGGTITPVKKKALTIPVTAEARGVSARTFQQQTGKNLFVVKGDAAKRNPDVVGSLVWEDPAGDLHAAYVLRKRSEVPPLKERRGHDAIPSEQQIVEWTRNAYIDYFELMSDF